MTYTVRPLSDRTWIRPWDRRETHNFKAKWSATRELLMHEIGYLRGRDVVIECDVQEKHIRNDGELRSDARPSDDAVVVAFDSKHGPLLYRSDRYRSYWSGQMPGWQANVRAVALTLEALRAVDRYGATETGQQYAGWKALPAGRAMPASHMTTTDAQVVIREWSGHHGGDYDLAQLVRRAKARAHPDRNDGDRTAWDQVEEAARALGVGS